ncbi:oligopeptide transporter, OPT family [Fontisphaera persica]|uniref:OPT family oligopeptide transporter n=1 Tax=Fontisphaera persica TaxID=2974023 RepID=UPI0024C052F8|nr:oligopeptide transporter, OPT family [Fontisphaera persica]WCJ60414.1 oligopeptide transporter, OPT family [Fontisphaera persica]
MSNSGSQDSTSGESPAFTPYLPPQARLPELTLRAVITGAVLGLLFGASSLYLVLKVGLTVSASIPVAVVSIALFRMYAKAGGRDATILEHNLIQTGGSAGESIAFGLGVTMPAIMILGFDLEIGRVMLVAVLGGLLGILMMIPLRRALIVQQHGRLKYPEGTACAEVLKAGASEESRRAAAAAGHESHAQAALSAHTIFTGFGIGLLYKTVMLALKGWKDIPGVVFGGPFKGGSVGVEVSPELLGVGYVIGPRIAAVLCAGGMLSYLLLIPLIKFFGEGLSAPLAPGKIPISQMTPTQVRQDYILYIGAGAVAAGGIISLLRSLPMLWHGLKSGLADLQAAGGPTGTVPRTEQDLSMHFVLGGIVLLVLAILFSPSLHMNLLGALLIVVFGFLFVTVSSRLTGEIGSSSNPISGMTVATLLLTCLIFLLMGWTGGTYFVTALSVGAIVCIAASNGGTTSQDLKTGFLVGATPKYQQIAILVGALVSALALGPILLKLNEAATVYVPAAEVAPGLRTDVSLLLDRETLRGPQAREDQRAYFVWHKTDATNGPPGKYLVDEQGRAVYLVDPGVNGHYSKRPDGTEVRKFDAPKAVLMSYIIKGILDRQLPWALVLFGVMIALILEMAGVPSLAFAVGVYLPISSSAPILAGGVVRWLVDRQMRSRLRPANLSEAELAAESDKSPGVLMASGYIAGGAIAGTLIAFYAGFFDRVEQAITRWAETHNPMYAGPLADLLSLIPFLVLALVLWQAGRRPPMPVKA